MYYVYVIYSDKIKRFYTGSTENLYKRLEHHNLGLNRWSRRGIPWGIVYFEKYETRNEVLKREKFLKSGKGRESIKARIAKLVPPRADQKTIDVESL